MISRELQQLRSALISVRTDSVSGPVMVGLIDLLERAEERIAELEAGAVTMTKIPMTPQAFDWYKEMCAARERAERAEAELKAMREVLELVDADVRHHLRSDAIDHALLRKNAVAAVRAVLNRSPAGPDGQNLAVLYCLERAEADVKLLREALEGMIAVAEGRFDGNPHADIGAIAKARAARDHSQGGEG